MVLTAFTARVRQGYYGQGHQIKVQSVSNAMAAISWLDTKAQSTGLTTDTTYKLNEQSKDGGEKTP